MQYILKIKQSFTIPYTATGNSLGAHTFGVRVHLCASRRSVNSLLSISMEFYYDVSIIHCAK